MTVCFVRSPTLSQIPKNDHKDKERKVSKRKENEKDIVVITPMSTTTTQQKEIFLSEFK